MVDVPVQAWCNLLRVTPAEANLVAALAQGKTLDEYAARRGISTGTARNQLKQVLIKTCTSRQVDLVRLALSSAAAHVLGALSATQA
jgi:DNA-binding CsgD family transcriptional regulator